MVKRIFCFFLFLVFFNVLRAYPDDKKEKLHSMGFGIGTGLGYPWFIANSHFTFAPFKHFFIEPGMDFGIWQLYEKSYKESRAGSNGEVTISEGKKTEVTGIGGDSEIGYYSFYPYIHLSSYFGFDDSLAGLYAGLGFGAMLATYTANAETTVRNSLAMDFFLGLILFNFDFSFTLRTDYAAINPKFQLGYTYIF
jgi:hypothetical protein